MRVEPLTDKVLTVICDPCLVQASAGSSASGKRPLPPTPGDHGEEVPRLSLVTALPLSVIQEHLQPLLSVKEAAGMRVVSKALKVLVMGWPMRLVDRDPPLELKAPAELEAALTCFPATESLTVRCEQPLTPAEERRMVELLRRHGGTLKVVVTGGEASMRMLSAAVLAGALPNLTQTTLFLLRNPVDRQILSEGMAGLFEVVRVSICADDAEQLAALEHLRRLPHLRCLMLADRRPEGAFPHFIPPSLKALWLLINRPGLLESLFHELPSMLQASGARLEEISLGTPNDYSAELGAVLAQVLRACSSTLKTFQLRYMGGPQVWGPRLSDCGREMVPGLVSCCDTLEVLHCPWAVFSALPATCPIFSRLTELTLSGGPDKDVNFTPRVWDIMANGCLPVLASFSTII
jgi:hypothetical protein